MIIKDPESKNGFTAVLSYFSIFLFRNLKKAGISTYPCMSDVEEDANTVIRYAEHALYNAKHRGRNKIIQFSQMNLEM